MVSVKKRETRGRNCEQLNEKTGPIPERDSACEVNPTGCWAVCTGLHGLALWTHLRGRVCHHGRLVFAQRQIVLRLH